MSVTLSTDDQRLKEATKALQRAAGGVEACEEITGLGKSQHGNYQNVNASDFIPINRVRELEAVTRDKVGWPHVTRLLCRMNGGVFIALPDASIDSTGLAEQASLLAAEFSDVCRETASALANGKLEGLEPERIIQELTEMIERALSMRLMVKALSDGPQVVVGETAAVAA